MELVYLWVEEYKNIKNQGFNFSPRFECEFDGENLTITENKDYVSIFPDNINITAIVGENGSGKSSILNEIDYKNYIIFDTLKKQLISCLHKIIINETNFELIELVENWNQSYEKIIVSWDLLGSSYTAENIINQHTEEINDNFEVESWLLTDRKLIPTLFEQKTLTYLFDKRYRFLPSIFNFCAQKLEINFKPLYPVIVGDNKINKIINNKINKIINKLEKNYLSEYKNILDIKEYFLLFLYKKYENDKLLDEIREKYRKENFLIDDLLIDIFEAIIDKKYKFGIEIEQIENLEIEINLYTQEILCTSKEYLIEEFSLIYEKNKEIIDFFIECSFIEINYINENDIKFTSLSQGQRTIFMQNLLIYSKILEFNSNKPIFLLLDEIDVHLHPRWQKEQIYNLINLLKKEKKKFHIIITSHSPFILSDIPKENVIFLEEGLQKYPFKKDEQTFGANIHTLLSHGFFMSEGLMGEFAKKTIQDVINYLDDKPTQNMNKQKAWQIIQLVGEPFLKHKLEEKYNEKFLTKEEQKQNKIKQLENELKRLKDDNTQS